MFGQGSAKELSAEKADFDKELSTHFKNKVAYKMCMR